MILTKPIILLLLLFESYLFSANCTISTPNVDYGIYDVFEPSNKTTINNINLSCTTSSNFDFVFAKVSLLGGNGSIGNKFLSNGSSSLFHNIFVKSDYTGEFGDGSNGTETFSLFLFLRRNQVKSKSKNIYFSIPALQTVSYGIYSDTYTVRASF